MRKLSKWDKIRIEILEDAKQNLRRKDRDLFYAYEGICYSISHTKLMPKRMVYGYDCFFLTRYFMESVGMHPPKTYGGFRLFWWPLGEYGYRKRLNEINNAIKRIKSGKAQNF